MSLDIKHTNTPQDSTRTCRECVREEGGGGGGRAAFHTHKHERMIDEEGRKCVFIILFCVLQGLVLWEEAEEEEEEEQKPGERRKTGRKDVWNDERKRGGEVGWQEERQEEGEKESEEGNSIFQDVKGKRREEN